MGSFTVDECEFSSGTAALCVPRLVRITLTFSVCVPISYDEGNNRFVILANVRPKFGIFDVSWIIESACSWVKLLAVSILSTRLLNLCTSSNILNLNFV